MKLNSVNFRPEFDAFVLKLVEYHTKRQKLIAAGTLTPEGFEYEQYPEPGPDDTPI